MLFFISD